MTKTQVQGALEQIMTSDYFRSEGLMCGGGGGGARPGMHGPVHQVTSQPQDGSMQGQDQEQEQWLSDENDKGERGQVSTPSLVQDQVGIAWRPARARIVAVTVPRKARSTWIW